VVAGLGHEVKTSGLVAWDDQSMEVVVTSGKVAGQTLCQLNPLVSYGVVVREVSRFGHTLVPSDDWVVQRMDVLQVRGPEEHVRAFAQAAGHHAKALEQTDVLSLATGLVLGVLVGLVPIGFGPDALRLGLAGGPMLVALVLSHFGRIGGVVGHFPPATQMFLVRFGLALLLSVAAMKAGTEVVAVFSEHGVTIVLMSLTINLAALGTGLLVSYVLLRQNFVETLTVLCGGANATPAYEVLAVKADSDIVLAIYTTAYAVTLILIVIVTQLLIMALGT
jgi:putative transport protein